MSTLTAFDFLNPAEKELYAFLKVQLSTKNPSALEAIDNMIRDQCSLQDWVQKIILCYDPTPLNGNIKINAQHIPQDITGENRKKLIFDKLIACLPYYTPEYKQKKQDQNIAAFQTYLNKLEEKWHLEGGSKDLLPHLATSMMGDQKGTKQNNSEHSRSDTDASSGDANLSLILKKYIIIKKAESALRSEKSSESKKTEGSLQSESPANFKKILIENFETLSAQRDSLFDQFLKLIGIQKQFYDLRFNLFGIAKKQSATAQQFGSQLLQFQKPRMAS